MNAKRTDKMETEGPRGFRLSGSALLGRLAEASAAVSALKAAGKQGALFQEAELASVSAAMSPAPFVALAELAYREEFQSTDDVVLLRAAQTVMESAPAPPKPGATPTEISSFLVAASNRLAMASAILRKAGVMPHFGCGESVAEDAGSGLKVALRFDGEGLCGKYDPSVFPDTRLLRFRLYVRGPMGFAEQEAASRLTMLPADMDASRRDRAAKLILDAILGEPSSARTTPSFLPEDVEAVCWKMSYLKAENLDALSAAGKG